jgi:hypothetical protein
MAFCPRRYGRALLVLAAASAYLGKTFGKT